MLSVLEEGQLHGRTLKITYLEDAKRELLVLLPLQDNHSCMHNVMESEDQSQANFTRKKAQISEESRRLLAQSFSRELYIDASAAFFYLNQADWNTRKAKQQFSKCLRSPIVSPLFNFLLSEQRLLNLDSLSMIQVDKILCVSVADTHFVQGKRM